MKTRVDELLEFHSSRFTISGRKARSLYRNLTFDEQSALVDAALSTDDDVRGEILRCFAAFQPDSLTRFHEVFLRRRIPEPPFLYYGASDEVATELVRMVEADEEDDALFALVWIRSSMVEQTFARWREKPPDFVEFAPWPSRLIGAQAGWELDINNRRRDLCTHVCYPLVRDARENPADEAVRTCLTSSQICPWCRRNLIRFLEIDHPSDYFNEIACKPLIIETCTFCTCLDTLYMKLNRDKVTWHPKNRTPRDLPRDPIDAYEFPEFALFVSESQRHPLEAIDVSNPCVSLSQIGGLPSLMFANEEYPECIDCERTMSFIGQLANADITGGEGTYFCFFCEKCDVTATSYDQT